MVRKNDIEMYSTSVKYSTSAENLLLLKDSLEP